MAERRGWALLGLVAIAAFGLLSLVVEPRGGASSRSGGAGGYRAVAAWLAASGREVVEHDRPLGEAPPDGLLVVATPLAAAWTAEDAAALQRRLDAGGAVLLLVGAADPTTHAVLDGMGLAVAPNPHAAPPAWWPWAWGDGGRELVNRDGATLRVKRARHRLVVPPTAEALWTDADGVAEAAILARRGPVAVFPASAFANAWIDEPGNLEALVAVLARVAPDGPVVFDEWHQGFQREAAVEAGPVRHVLTAIFAQGALLYGLALWTLSRRSGPPRARPLPPPPAVAGELGALARLHREAGHAGEAGSWLLAEARRSGMEGLPPRFEGGEAELLALGRRVAAGQRRWGFGRPRA